MNQTMITVVGNVATDPVLRRTADNQVVNFRLASTERRFDSEKQEWVDGEKLFVSVNCWGRLAETVDGMLHRGDPVMVIGKVYTRNYELDGVNRSSVELRAFNIGPDLSRCGVHLIRRGESAAA